MTTTPAAVRHFAVTYTRHAPEGCPPVVRADQVIRYTDNDGDWTAFLLEPPGQRVDPVSRAVWRIATDLVESVEAHRDAVRALTSVLAHSHLRRVP